MRTQCALLVSAMGLMMGCGLLDAGGAGSGPGPNTSVGGLRIEAPLGVNIRESPDTGPLDEQSSLSVHSSLAHRPVGVDRPGDPDPRSL